MYVGPTNSQSVLNKRGINELDIVHPQGAFVLALVGDFIIIQVHGMDQMLETGIDLVTSFSLGQVFHRH